MRHSFFLFVKETRLRTLVPQGKAYGIKKNTHCFFLFAFKLRLHYPTSTKRSLISRLTGHPYKIISIPAKSPLSPECDKAS